jgi:1-acyl-sn-glycerol-3-phosphate acyltransferase
VRITGQAGAPAVTDAGPPELDPETVRSYWRAHLGTGTWPVEDLFFAIFERFVGRVFVLAPRELSEVADRRPLFLANHQVAIESLLFSMIGGGVCRHPVVTIAKTEHQSTWLGRLAALCRDYPGITLPRVLALFDRQDQASLLPMLRELRATLDRERLCLMVHAAGTRSLHCRQPVARLSAMFLDLALDADLPIVPVRFSGGLPEAAGPGAQRLDFPLGYARQDIYFGRPILPETLREMALPGRKRVVLDALNGLGPELEHETPNPPDPGFASEVGDVVRELGMSEPKAVTFNALRRATHRGPATEALIEAICRGVTVSGELPEARWLARLQRWFMIDD